MGRIYMCIDLKSFYASVECVERKLDPLNTNLVVADAERTEKTICLAVSPSLKQYGISGRARLFEVVQKVKEINFERKRNNRFRDFEGKSYLDSELKANKKLELDFIAARPRMAKYMEYSTRIYNIYLKYLAPEDIYVYSIDEVFCDITDYLNYYKKTPRELVSMMIQDVYQTTGITATAGIGTNLYLAKVCMDIVAKHTEPNEYGVRIGEIDEQSYRELLWDHQPLTSFWRVGRGYQKKLNNVGIYTMGDVARCSLNNEELLYKLFGVNAELLIDHAWGYEPTEMKDIRSYKPQTSSLSTGQVLHAPYDYEKTRLIVKEMIDSLCLDLVEKHYVTNQLVLQIGYDIENLSDPDRAYAYKGEVVVDGYGRRVPKHAHGTVNLKYHTSRSTVLSKKCVELYERIINPKLLCRRVTIVACNLLDEHEVEHQQVVQQYSLFDAPKEDEYPDENERLKQKEENKLQHAVLAVKKKYGKNAIIKGMNLEEGATMMDRNGQIGGHRE